MVKTLEQYLSELSFAPPEPTDSERSLNSGERAFVEKYLGLDALESLPLVDPQPLFKPARPLPPTKTMVMEPRIEVAPPKLVVAQNASVRQESIEKIATQTAAPVSQIASPPAKMAAPDIAKPITVVKEAVEPKTEVKTAIAVAPVQASATVMERQKVESPVQAQVKTEIADREIQEVRVQVETRQTEKIAAPTITKPAQVVKDAVAPPKTEARIETEIKTADVVTVAPTVEKDQTSVKDATEQQEQQKSASHVAEALSLRDTLKQQSEIQMVSFFVKGQLFLLPVEGIQEVLRNMELIRLPQAPQFVAGVINLRGKVTPLVHLSAILTNETEHIYDEKKHFIIVCGTENLQVGLIIDKINSMHMLPADKIIWNVESKLGDTADFLYAIANLDDRVCGIVAPEMITKKILSA